MIRGNKWDFKFWSLSNSTFDTDLRPQAKKKEKENELHNNTLLMQIPHKNNTQALSFLKCGKNCDRNYFFFPGTAMEALSSMQTFLKSRPSTFGSLEEGIEWRYGTADVQHCSFLHYLVNHLATSYFPMLLCSYVDLYLW